MAPTRGPVPIRSTERDFPHEMLQYLNSNDTLQSNEVYPDVPEPEVKSAIQKLASRSMVEFKANEKELVLLTKESEDICAEGSPEYRVWAVIKQKGKIAIKDLPKEVGADVAKVGQGNAFKNKWIKKDGDSFVLIKEEVEDTAREVLSEIKESKSVDEPKLLAELKRRKLVTTAKAITYTVTKGPKYATEIPEEATDLTADMLANGSWQTTNFKPYNFRALGGIQNSGALHPLNKVRAEFRAIFFNQGFVEMPTNRYVDTGFWNFDALFVPQQHPARDMQDTFFISDPPKGDKPRDDAPAEKAMDDMEKGARTLYAVKEPRQSKPRDYEKYWNDVQAVHEGGAFGSIGYRYKWSEDESLRLVLRTHTTAISTWALHRLAEDPRPARYFSIDRVFRNETVDATHLAEFHQVEGVIADFGLTLGGLMKFLEDFFGKLGITNLRFKPAYNPYTEPSMEIFGYHQGLGKWVEIGNSGMFRPEMLEPMGLPADMRVYGFGLSLERPTMIRYGVSNIRDLLGHKVDLGFIENNASVRLDKN